MSEVEIEAILKRIAADRALLNDIDAYCKNPFVKDILAICGLRRTGKTILALRQALNLIKSGRRVAYLQINKGDSKQKLLASINRAADNNTEYIFIDEITYIDGFARWADCVYNKTALKGIYCIIIGTDSFGLILASHELLFGRVEFIKTTHMPYADFKNVVNGSLSSYIHTGGVFGRIEMAEYVDASIASNIVGSINRYDEMGYRILSELEDDELRTAIIKAVSRISIRFVIRILTRKYNYPEIGSAKQILGRDIDEYIVENEDKIKNEVYGALGLKEDLSRFSYEELGRFINYIRSIFVEIDAVTKYDIVSAGFDNEGFNTEKEYMLAQPALRFEQTMVYLNILSSLDGAYQPLIKTILQDIEGSLIEAVIISETVRKYLGKCDNESNRKYDVFKFNYMGREIDMVQYSYAAEALNLYEIKRTDNIYEGHYKNLNDAEVLEAVRNAVSIRNPLMGRIVYVNKHVLYSGVTLAEAVDGVRYVNIEDYLLSL